MFKRKNTTIKCIWMRFFGFKKHFGFDTSQFEGRLEKPIGKKTFIYFGALIGFFGLFFVSRIFFLQIFEGEKFTARSERNSLKKENITPLRGAVYDSVGTALVWNGEDGRAYADIPGLGHILGYTGLPSKEDFRKKPDISLENIVGKDGIEEKYDEILRGILGIKLTERDSPRQSSFRKRSGPPPKRPKSDLDHRLKSPILSLYSNGINRERKKF